MKKAYGIAVIVALLLVVLGGAYCASKSGDEKTTIASKDSENPIPEMEMIYVPASAFLMGISSVGDDLLNQKIKLFANEHPQHSVYLSAYSIGKYEVTRGEYRKFMEAGGYSNSEYWSSEGWKWKLLNKRTQPEFWATIQNWSETGSTPCTFTQTDKHPVVGVNYYEAEAFCKWAGGHLPTEAQWEKAARWDVAKNHPNVYPWGDWWDAKKSNNRDDKNYLGYNQTAPVGSFPNGTSPYGCHDMAGNVSEWCADWYTDWNNNSYYKQTPTGGWIDPQGPTSNVVNFRARAHRGGGWSNYHRIDADPSGYFIFGVFNYDRCSRRDKWCPELCSNSGGFRLAR